MQIKIRFDAFFFFFFFFAVCRSATPGLLAVGLPEGQGVQSKCGHTAGIDWCH